MTDTIVNEELAEADAAIEPVAEKEAKPEKAEKVVKQPEACACSEFEIVDESDPENPASFGTDCKSTTLRTFAQGHDARLVSFLVQGEFDGLKVYRTTGGVRYSYEGAAHAAGSISEALGAKAEAAIARLHAAKAVKDDRDKARAATREAKQAEKAAAKVKREEEAAAKKAEKATAKAPREVGAKVVEGSQEGGNTDGFTRIKVGRGEYDAIGSQVDNGEGGTKLVYTYRNLRGEEETRDADTVRVLTK